MAKRPAVAHLHEGSGDRIGLAGLLALESAACSQGTDERSDEEKLGGPKRKKSSKNGCSEGMAEQ